MQNYNIFFNWQCIHAFNCSSGLKFNITWTPVLFTNVNSGFVHAMQSYKLFKFLAIVQMYDVNHIDYSHKIIQFIANAQVLKSKARKDEPCLIASGHHAKIRKNRQKGCSVTTFLAIFWKRSASFHEIIPSARSSLFHIFTLKTFK